MNGMHGRRWDLRRWAAVAGLLVTATACVPEVSPSSPYGCGASLGVGSSVRGMSDDGNVIVIEELRANAEPRYSYWVIDRAAGTRMLAATAGAGSDGTRSWIDPLGTTILFLRYPTLDAGTSAWAYYDVATGTTTPVAITKTVDEDVYEIASDARTALIRSWNGTFRKLDIPTGVSTPLALTIPAGERLEDVSPSLDRALLGGTTAGATGSARVVSTATNTTIRTIGPFSREFRLSNGVSFVDEFTVLVDDAVPVGAPDDGIPNDGAFLVALADGAITRIDPGVWGASTFAVNPSGATSIYSLLNDPSMWLHRPGSPDERLTDEYGVWANPALDVAVVQQGDELVVRCI